MDDFNHVDVPVDAPVVTPEQSYADRSKAFFAQPELLENISATLANGGDFITFCRMHDIRYSDLCAWITSDVTRGIRLAKAERARNEWVKNRILNELSILALSDIRDAFKDNGDLKPPSEWPEHIAKALAGVDVEALFSGTGREREQVGYTKKVKLYNKIEALKLIGQEFGLFVQKHKIEVTEKLEDLVADSFVEEPPRVEEPQKHD